MSQEPTTLESIALMLVKLDGKVDTVAERLESLSGRVDTMAVKLDEVARVQREHGEMLRDHSTKLNQLLVGGIDMAERHSEWTADIEERVSKLERERSTTR